MFSTIIGSQLCSWKYQQKTIQSALFSDLVRIHTRVRTHTHTHHYPLHLILFLPALLTYAFPLGETEGKISSGHVGITWEETCFANVLMWLLATLFGTRKTVRTEYSCTSDIIIFDLKNIFLEYFHSTNQESETKNNRLHQTLALGVACDVCTFAGRWWQSTQVDGVLLWITVNSHKTKDVLYLSWHQISKLFPNAHM